MAQVFLPVFCGDEAGYGQQVFWRGLRGIAGVSGAWHGAWHLAGRGGQGGVGGNGRVAATIKAALKSALGHEAKAAWGVFQGLKKRGQIKAIA